MGQDDHVSRRNARAVGSPETSKNCTFTSEDGSLLSENVEAYELDYSEEIVRKPHQGNRSKKGQRRQVQGDDDKPKSLVDPRKYKTKMCRNWKATGQCPYEHTCCYAHGDLETRTMQQNNNVLSSLGYFSGIMLLAMKNDDDVAPNPKPPRQAKKGNPKGMASLVLKQPQMPAAPPQSVPKRLQEPNTPTVHSPYCLPGEGPSFGTESSPSSPMGFVEPQMPPYSYRMEGYPKSPSFPPGYPMFDPQYEGYEYAFIPNPYLPFKTEAHPPMHYPICDYPTFECPPGACYSQEAHQAALEKHPAVRNVQSGDMSHKQLQKVLHDIMHSQSNGSKQRKPKKKFSNSEVPAEE